jgi:type III secretion protein N (ATPase)
VRGLQDDRLVDQDQPLPGDGEKALTRGPNLVESLCADWISQRLPGLRAHAGVTISGTVYEVVGTDVMARLPMGRLGMLCMIERSRSGDEPLLAEVVGFSADGVRLTAMGSLQNVGPGDEVRVVATEHFMDAGPELCGDILDAYGRSLVGRQGAFTLGAPTPSSRRVLHGSHGAMQRAPISEAFQTGVRALDGLMTIGRGQRVGIFAGPGCGKTTLLSAIAQGCTADYVVFGLIGERGRALQEFVHEMQSTELSRRLVIVAASSDRSSLERARAAATATTVAEALAAGGHSVLLLIDSLTRYARAQREIGIAAGEPPGRGGFPPSFYTSLPRLVERAGNFTDGCITAIYTVLSEQDLEADPVADEARSLLDGHIVLARKLAEAGHYPAIDVLRSLSRTMGGVVTRSQSAAAQRVRRAMARHEALDFLIKVGEYKPGRVAEDDQAVQAEPAIRDFLCQDLRERAVFEHTVEQLDGLVV